MLNSMRYAAAMTSKWRSAVPAPPASWEANGRGESGGEAALEIPNARETCLRLVECLVLVMSAPRLSV